MIQQFKIKLYLRLYSEKIELKVYVNQHYSVSDMKTPSRS